jgi:Ca2+-binding RTX toxin-like protein
MALTKLYGVNHNYNSSDDFYIFSKSSGVFIVDGGGYDTISMLETLENAYIDLRPGSHSFVGMKNEYITGPYQLTISHNSFIENVISSLGSDTIVGNALGNLILSQSGDDKIFAGEGADKIDTGQGHDLIDLSELEPSKDTVILNVNNLGPQFDVVYGFTQGRNGDYFDVTSLIDYKADLLPVIMETKVPEGYISDHILRLVGGSFLTETSLCDELDDGGVLQNLIISDSNPVLVIASISKETGPDQKIFLVEKSGLDHNVDLLAHLKGNYLDIDIWVPENFIDQATDLII